MLCVSTVMGIEVCTAASDVRPLMHVDVQLMRDRVNSCGRWGSLPTRWGGERRGACDGRRGCWDARAGDLGVLQLSVTAAVLSPARTSDPNRLHPHKETNLPHPERSCV